MSVCPKNKRQYQQVVTTLPDMNCQSDLLNSGVALAPCRIIHTGISSLTVEKNNPQRSDLPAVFSETGCALYPSGKSMTQHLSRCERAFRRLMKHHRDAPDLNSYLLSQYQKRPFLNFYNQE